MGKILACPAVRQTGRAVAIVRAAQPRDPQIACHLPQFSRRALAIFWSDEDNAALKRASTVREHLDLDTEREQVESLASIVGIDGSEERRDVLGWEWQSAISAERDLFSRAAVLIL